MSDRTQHLDVLSSLATQHEHKCVCRWCCRSSMPFTDVLDAVVKSKNEYECVVDVQVATLEVSRQLIRTYLHGGACTRDQLVQVVSAMSAAFHSCRTDAKLCMTACSVFDEVIVSSLETCSTCDDVLSASSLYHVIRAVVGIGMKSVYNRVILRDVLVDIMLKQRVVVDVLWCIHYHHMHDNIVTSASSVFNHMVQLFGGIGSVLQEQVSEMVPCLCAGVLMATLSMELLTKPCPHPYIGRTLMCCANHPRVLPGVAPLEHSRSLWTATVCSVLPVSTSASDSMSSLDRMSWKSKRFNIKHVGDSHAVNEYCLLIEKELDQTRIVQFDVVYSTVSSDGTAIYSDVAYRERIALYCEHDQMAKREAANACQSYTAYFGSDWETDADEPCHASRVHVTIIPGGLDICVVTKHAGIVLEFGMKDLKRRSTYGTDHDKKDLPVIIM